MFKTFKGAFVLALISSCTVSTIAQQTQSLEEVQVTANRYPQKQTGKTLTILNDSLLRANEGQTLSQILQSQAGLLVLGKGQPYGSVQSIAVRGAGFGQTLILLDGIPVNEPSGIGSTFDINLLSVQNIERIEILKDGQSTVYGSDAIAGVINIITKKHAAQKASINAGIMGGSFGTLNADATLSGRINKTQYTLGVSSINSKGFSSAAVPNGEEDGYSDLGLHAKLTQHITHRLSANGLLRYQKYKTDLDEAALMDDKDYTFTSDNLMFGGGLNYDLSKGKIIFNYLGSTIDRSFTNDSSDVPMSAWSKYSFNQYHSKAHFLELYSNFSISEQLKFLAGISHQIQNMDYSGFEISDFGRTDFEDINADLAKINNTSVYATVNGTFKGGFGFEAGARTNFHSAYGNTLTFNLNPYFFFDDQFKVFASYGSSFRNPALYQLFSPYGNVNLSPELAKTYEAGFQVFGEDKRDFMRIVAFGRQYNDMIIFESTTTAPWGRYNNLDQKASNKGVELEGQKQWNKLSTGFNYTLLDGTISDDLVQDGDEIRAFLRRPNHTINLRVGYNFGKKLTIGLQSQSLSKRNDTFYNSTNYETEGKILKAFTLIHLQANYALTENIKINFSGQNIFNVDYQEVYGYNSRKATLLGGVRVNF
jgi:vitamin B12 transporter